MLNRFIVAVLFLAAGFLAMAIMPDFAFAAAAVTEKTKIDLAPLTQGHEGLLYFGLLALAALAYKFLSKFSWFNKLVTKEQYQKLIDPLLNEAVAYGVGKLKDANWLKIETKNEAVATALTYALEHGGDLLDKFGIGEEALKQKIEAKLVQNGWDTAPGKWDNAPK